MRIQTRTPISFLSIRELAGSALEPYIFSSLPLLVRSTIFTFQGTALSYSHNKGPVSNSKIWKLPR